MPKNKRLHKACVGCDEHFTTFRNYDYCPSCEVNGSRYLSKDIKDDKCSECDGSGWIKFRGQPKRPCKLCALTKPMKRNKTSTQLSSEEQFWDGVEKKSKELIAELVEKVLPIDATPKNFDLEKDVDYRVLIRGDIPQNYYDLEEYQVKIANQSWTEDDVEYVAQEATVYYFDLVAQNLARWLSDNPAFRYTKLSQLYTN